MSEKEETTFPVLRPPAFAKTPKAPKLFIATPCYGGDIKAPYVWGLTQSLLPLAHLGIRVDLWAPFGDSFIARARNKAAADFLASDCTHLLFIDADVGFSPNDIAALIACDEPVVCGAYPMKDMNWRALQEAVKKGRVLEELPREAARYPVNLFPEALERGEVRGFRRNERSYIEIQDAATGFLLIAREVFETILKETGPRLEYVTDYEPRGVIHHRFFDGGEDPVSPRQATMYRLSEAARTGDLELVQQCAIEHAAAWKAEPGRYVTEDYFFSRLAQLCGYRIWLCLDIELTHTGTWTFRGNLERVIPFRELKATGTR